MSEPTARFLSCGAGRQTLAIAMLSAEGTLPKIDAAIFADTGWEPRAVYQQLDRLEREILTPAGIPLYRVSRGNLRDDLLDPNKMRSIPAHTRGQTMQKMPHQWRRCDCAWAELRAWLTVHGENVEVLAEFEPGTTISQLELAAASEAIPVAEGDLLLFGAEFPASLLVSTMLRDVGLEAMPAEHQACNCSGRVPTAWHMMPVIEDAMLKRRCTQIYKINKILEQARKLLGGRELDPRPCRYCEGTGARIAPWRAKRGEHVLGICSVCDGEGETSRIGQPPKGVWAEQWIGFAADEVGRASTHHETRYSRNRFPLMEIGMTTPQCVAFLGSRGWKSVVKSACIGCPLHGNAAWRQMRNTDQESWDDAVRFDHSYRHGPGMKHERFLHASRQPLAIAPIDRTKPSDYERPSLEDLAYEAEIQRIELGDPDGCSPYGCRSGEPVAVGGVNETLTAPLDASESCI